MIGLLANAVAQLKTLQDRLTAARAAYLDAAVSTRAAASDYTGARAAKLDQLDEAISSRAAASDYTPTRAAYLDKLQYQPTAIKSIQRGVISFVSSNETQQSATLSPAVNTAKTELRFLGFSTGAADTTDPKIYIPMLTLDNSSTVTATRNLANSTYNLYVSWEITEYY